MKTILLFLALLPAMWSAQTDVQKLKKEYSQLTEKSSYGNNPKAGQYYDVNGIKMYCETYGQGQPLLLIHGNGGSIVDFSKQIPFFSKHYKVIVADSRAHAKSLDKGDALTYEMMSDDYAELLNKMKIDSALVIGWSDGGINGLLLSIRHPEKVKKLIVTGANLRPDSSAVETDIYKRVSANYAEFKKQMAVKKNKKDLDYTVLKYKRLLSEQPNINTKDLHQIKIPVLVIGGDYDVIKPEHTLEIFRNIPKANLWILPDSGHSTLVVYTDEFNAKADTFFKTKFRTIRDRDREF
ncbi:alpha/beta hydrolase [Chryseobacterium lactis]|uniref:Alpha/beta hydrolase n=1 Tax=Chryseobacterium lactis TaxID=1241981 RepID=A0A3G6RIB0_CHRLC|nr:alpha/beta hydrolase [Chryseobacterium lactis]AZA83208.1 alpha/beta hydrolase [Chryseobacterium lactis]AZB03593.1 alpha/beta hydrolase [Chryseobacterium lactis]PNW11901.1 alpha/beta hydrolase [Chryseobacterium lactis]